MSRLSVSAYIEFHQHTNSTFDPYMPVVVIGALAGGVVLAVTYGVHSIPGQLAAAGAVCYALVIIIGVPTRVRINKQIASPKCARAGFGSTLFELYSPFPRLPFILDR